MVFEKFRKGILNSIAAFGLSAYTMLSPGLAQAGHPGNDSNTDVETITGSMAPVEKVEHKLNDPMRDSLDKIIKQLKQTGGEVTIQGFKTCEDAVIAQYEKKGSKLIEVTFPKDFSQRQYWQFIREVLPDGLSKIEQYKIHKPANNYLAEFMSNYYQSVSAECTGKESEDAKALAERIIQSDKLATIDPCWMKVVGGEIKFDHKKRKEECMSGSLRDRKKRSINVEAPDDLYFDQPIGTRTIIAEYDKLVELGLDKGSLDKLIEEGVGKWKGFEIKVVEKTAKPAEEPVKLPEAPAPVLVKSEPQVIVKEVVKEVVKEQACPDYEGSIAELTELVSSLTGDVESLAEQNELLQKAIKEPNKYLHTGFHFTGKKIDFYVGTRHISEFRTKPIRNLERLVDFGLKKYTRSANKILDNLPLHYQFPQKHRHVWHLNEGADGNYKLLISFDNMVWGTAPLDKKTGTALKKYMTSSDAFVQDSFRFRSQDEFSGDEFLDSVAVVVAKELMARKDKGSIEPYTDRELDGYNIPVRNALLEALKNVDEKTNISTGIIGNQLVIYNSADGKIVSRAQLDHETTKRFYDGLPKRSRKINAVHNNSMPSSVISSYIAALKRCDEFHMDRFSDVLVMDVPYKTLFQSEEDLRTYTRQTTDALGLSKLEDIATAKCDSDNSEPLVNNGFANVMSFGHPSEAAIKGGQGWIYAEEISTIVAYIAAIVGTSIAIHEGVKGNNNDGQGGNTPGGFNNNDPWD